MVLIYRLTDKNGMLGYGICHNSKTNPFDNSKGAHPSMPTFGGVTSISRLGGVRAIVTSHQAVDDEKMYGKGAGSSAHSSASHGSTQAYANKQSVVNIVPNVPKNSGPFSSSPVKGHTDGDLSDAESISDEDLKSFPQTKATSRAL